MKCIITMKIQINQFTTDKLNFCKKYIEGFPKKSAYPTNLAQFESEVNQGDHDHEDYDISPNEPDHWPYLLIAERYVQKHKSKSAGRRHSKKRSARRRRSSKSRKSRSTRRK